MIMNTHQELEEKYKAAEKAHLELKFVNQERKQILMVQILE